MSFMTTIDKKSLYGRYGHAPVAASLKKRFIVIFFQNAFLSLFSHGQKDASAGMRRQG